MNVTPSSMNEALSKAHKFLTNGRVEDARKLLEKVLAQQSNFDAYLMLGIVFAIQRKFDRSIKAFSSSIQINPDHPRALFNRANAYSEFGEHSKALIDVEKSLSIEPNNFEASLVQANALAALGRIEESLNSYDQILQAKPNWFKALNNKGLALTNHKRFNEAVEYFDKAIALAPNIAEFHNNRGNALLGLEKKNEALESFNRAIGLKPDFADALFNRGNTLKALNRLEEALISFDKAIILNPNLKSAYLKRGCLYSDLNIINKAIVDFKTVISSNNHLLEAYLNCGIAYSKNDQYIEALECFNNILAINPASAEAYLNIGAALHKLRKLNEAIYNYNKAIDIYPKYAEAYSNLGKAYQELNKSNEAIDNYDKAISLITDYADAYWNKALILLVNGQLLKGFELYEWRLKNEQLGLKSRAYSQPLWNGKQTLSGKTILLYWEQGLGDTIHFCRYARLVKALGATVVLECQKPLMKLLQGLSGVDKLIDESNSFTAFDYHCPLLSLPLALKTELHNIPSNLKYLYACEERRAIWNSRLGDKTKKRVGIVWSGNAGHKNDQNRSILLSDFLNTLPSGFEYISLQKEIREIDADALARSNISHFGDELTDFSDTAALVDLMDLVISVDTSVAHLSGALGKETWVLLPYLPDWRWMLDREGSPWYPSIRLYRQKEDASWQPVLARLALDLLKLNSN